VFISIFIFQNIELERSRGYRGGKDTNLITSLQRRNNVARTRFIHMSAELLSYKVLKWVHSTRRWEVSGEWDS